MAAFEALERLQKFDWLIQKLHSLRNNLHSESGLQELQKLLQYYHVLKSKESFDVMTLVCAAQVVIGARVEEKYGLTSEDMARAVIAHHMALSTDQIQQALAQQLQ